MRFERSFGSSAAPRRSGLALSSGWLLGPQRRSALNGIVEPLLCCLHKPQHPKYLQNQVLEFEKHVIRGLSAQRPRLRVLWASGCPGLGFYFCFCSSSLWYRG